MLASKFQTIPSLQIVNFPQILRLIAKTTSCVQRQLVEVLNIVVSRDFEIYWPRLVKSIADENMEKWFMVFHELLRSQKNVSRIVILCCIASNLRIW